MTLRERLADWISGGALTRARIDARHHETLAGIYLDANRAANVDFFAKCQFSERRQSALRAIAAMETPKANATVKRMAKTARKARE